MAWGQSVPLDYIEQAVNLASQEFIKGFLAGQFALLFLIFIIVKFFFLRGSIETNIEQNRPIASPKVLHQFIF